MTSCSAILHYCALVTSSDFRDKSPKGPFFPANLSVCVPNTKVISIEVLPSLVCVIMCDLAVTLPVLVTALSYLAA